jgi:large subunit ribosomal protein L3
MLGAIAKKVGMSSLFQDCGTRVPVTLLRLEPSRVIALKVEGKHGYNAVVVGAGEVKDKHLTKPMRGMFEKLKDRPVRHIKEFRVDSTEGFKVGDVVDAGLFVSGQPVDVRGITIGKGFAGGMKRHNFAGLEASHGVSISHRSHGSTGGCQDPGRVFKNKKMAGHMGSRSCSKQNLRVISVDSENNIIIVKGSVPGFANSLVYVAGAIKKSQQNRV